MLEISMSVEKNITFEEKNSVDTSKLWPHITTECCDK